MFNITNRKLEIVTASFAFLISVVLLLSGWLTFHSNRLYVEAELEANRVNEQLRALDVTLSTFQDAEIGQRGYLLTGNPAYLEPYSNATREIEASLNWLSRSMQHESLFESHLAELAVLKRQKLDELASTLKLSAEFGSDKAIALVKTDRGKQVMDHIRALIGEMIITKRQQLAKIHTASLERARRSELSTYWFGGIIVLFLLCSYVYLVYDLRERRRLRQRAEFLENRDALTGLYNRRFLITLVANAVKNAFRHGSRSGLLFVSLHSFKDLNDMLGENVGDALLIETASRLSETIREGHQLARLQKDEFAILVPEAHSFEELSILAARLIQAVTPALIPDMPDKYVGVSIGIAVSPDNGQSAFELMAHADMAMQEAKEEPGSSYRFYCHTRNVATSREEQLTIGLHRAVEQENFALLFQPLVDARTQKPVSVEVLVRWNHPELGSVSPEEFIPIAEKTGLILPLGAWVLRQACVQIRQWNEEGHALRAAVNVSAAEMLNENFSERVIEALAHSGLPPEQLELEITERVMMDQNAGQELQKVRQLGVHISIDDFGTGFSSFSYLSRFSIDVLKIDRSFIRRVPNSGKDCGIVKAIIGIGKGLGITLVAEGIETQEQAQFLRENGCDVVQGYLFCKPGNASEIGKLINMQAADTRYSL